MYHCSQLLYETIVAHENLVGENITLSVNGK